jgi:hypothetical protein
MGSLDATEASLARGKKTPARNQVLAAIGKLLVYVGTHKTSATAATPLIVELLESLVLI